MSHFCVAVFTDKNSTVEELLAPYDENMEVEPYEDTDGEMSTYNPDSKWDWWVECGRYTHVCELFHIPEGGIRVGDLLQNDLFDQQTYNKAIRDWELIVEGLEPETDADREAMKFAWFKPEWYKETYLTKEQYANERATFGTWAVVLPDGNWHEPGRVGLFAVDDATPEQKREWFDCYKERFLETADPDWTLHVIDCHI